MGTTRQEAIELRAHQLWEESGRVHGKHDEHWDQAEREVDAAAAGDVEGETTVTPPGPDVTTPSKKRRANKV